MAEEPTPASGEEPATVGAEEPTEVAEGATSVTAEEPRPPAPEAPDMPAEPAPDMPGALPVAEADRARRKVREGTVVSDKMQDTVVVAVVERVRHAKYGKTVQRTKKVYAHDSAFSARLGDRVRVQETRPLSKLKRWRVTEVLERAR